MTAQDYRTPDSVGRLQRNALVAGGIALLVCIFGAIKSPQIFFPSYLMGYLLVLGLALGSLGLLMLQHLTGGHWGIVIRRPLESATRTLPLLAVLFLPIVFGMKYLYGAWLDPERVRQEQLSAMQQGYLTAHWFYIRAIIYFVVWIGLMLIFNRWSREQDINQADRALRRRFKMLAGPGIILYVFVMTFAAIDWVP
jgi:hypothetical protein